ncbi:hypothetical protein ACFE04_016032 [Oxalis oulophora]
MFFYKPSLITKNPNSHVQPLQNLRPPQCLHNLEEVCQPLKVLIDVATESAKYVFPKRFESRNLEEALMAETTMPGKTGILVDYLNPFMYWQITYLNTKKETMEMTTPVFTRKTQSCNGEKMDMTTPVITKKIKEVPKKLVAVVAFSAGKENYEMLPLGMGLETNAPVRDGAQLHPHNTCYISIFGLGNRQLSIFHLVFNPYLLFSFRVWCRQRTVKICSKYEFEFPRYVDTDSTSSSILSVS